MLHPMNQISMGEISLSHTHVERARETIPWLDDAGCRGHDDGLGRGWREAPSMVQGWTGGGEGGPSFVRTPTVACLHLEDIVGKDDG